MLGLGDGNTIVFSIMSNKAHDMFGAAYVTKWNQTEKLDFKVRWQHL